MGAWAEGAFDNDDAADWAAQFDGADQEEGLRLIEDALRQAAQTPPGQLRASPAQGQLAALWDEAGTSWRTSMTDLASRLQAVEGSFSER